MVLLDGPDRPRPTREDLLPWRAGRCVASGVASLRGRFAADPPAVDAEDVPPGWPADDGWLPAPGVLDVDDDEVAS